MRRTNRKALRKANIKRLRKTQTRIKITKPKIATYAPKKKAYEKPAFGSIPKPDYHVYGPFDGFFTGAGSKGISGGLNRVEREYPGTFDTINTWVQEGRITWIDVQDSFAEYYFDDRGDNRFEYLLNPYEVFTSGYENFMTNLRFKAGF